MRMDQMVYNCQKKDEHLLRITFCDMSDYSYMVKRKNRFRNRGWSKNLRL